MRLRIRIGLAVVFLFAAAWTIHAQSTPRVFMLITASVEPGHMAEYQRIVEKQVLPIFDKHDVEIIAAFNSAIGGHSNETMLLVAYNDFAHMQRALADPDIIALQSNEFESMRVLTTRTLVGTSFSPLK